MSKAIAKLLGKPEHLVGGIIDKLENLNGFPSEDVRLIADNTQRIRQKVFQLGLDPSDTTAEELYQGLRAKLNNDSSQLNQAVGISADSLFEHKIEWSIKLIESMGELPERWLLRRQMAKKMLNKTPPKRLMKQLNYHSLLSLLKRENIDDIFLAAAWTESNSWQRATTKLKAKLNTADFDVRNLHVAILKESFYQNITGPISGVAANPELGSVALWPPSLPDDARVLDLSLLLVDALEKLAGEELGSRLYGLHPSLSWWAGNTSLVANLGGEQVSMSIKDLSDDILWNKDYPNRSNHHGREALFRHLLSLYQDIPLKLTDDIKNMGYNLSSIAAAPGQGLPFAPQLEPEYSMAE